jgi:hypothetical protein
MVGHQDIRVQDPPAQPDGLGQELEELQPVTVGPEDVPTLVPAARDVRRIGAAGTGQLRA